MNPVAGSCSSLPPPVSRMGEHGCRRARLLKPLSDQNECWRRRSRLAVDHGADVEAETVQVPRPTPPCTCPTLREEPQSVPVRLPKRSPRNIALCTPTKGGCLMTSPPLAEPPL